MDQKLPAFIAALALFVVVGIWWKMQSGPGSELLETAQPMRESMDQAQRTPERRPRNANRGDLRARREAWMAAREQKAERAEFADSARRDEDGRGMAAQRAGAASQPGSDAGLADGAPQPTARRSAKERGLADTPEDIAELTKVAMSDPDPDERINALWSLAISDEAKALPVLTNALRDDDREVRLAAVQELGGLEDEHAVVDSLTQALNDGDNEVRTEAVRLIGETDDPRAAELAGRLLNDPDPDVREEAQSIIESAEE